MWKNRAKVVLPRRVASEPAKNLGNYCPVKVTVSLSWCTFLLVAVFLLAFILCALLSVVQVTYLTTSWMVPACLHGSNYYWLSGAYCLLFSLYAMKRLCYLGRLGPTKLCRLGGVMFISAFIEYLIFTEIIYSTLTVESITGKSCLGKRASKLTAAFLLVQNTALKYSAQAFSP